MTNDSLKPIDITAPTLEEAIDEGLHQLGLTRDDVIIEIMEEGSRGVWGMGARNAVVRLTPLRPPKPPVEAKKEVPKKTPAPPPPVETKPDPVPVAEKPRSRPRPAVDDEADRREAELAAETLGELFAHMGVEAKVDVHKAEQASEDEIAPWVLDVQGRDLGVLIGRKGETLNALQHITRLIVSREIQQRANVVIDIEGYKARRESSLRKLALRMAKQVKQYGRPITLEPMPPNERRIIHITLRSDKNVETESVGVGDQRKVTIIPVSRN